jgi:hypothetical protein
LRKNVPKMKRRLPPPPRATATRRRRIIMRPAFYSWNFCAD